MNRIVLFGCPRPIGGANDESGHTALLWRRMGIDVTIIPSSKERIDNPWIARLVKAGCTIKPEIKPDDLPHQAWLFRSTIVDFANERAVRCWDRLARMNCKLVHVPCMTFAYQHEHDGFRHRPPTAVMFQSEFQRKCLALQYAAWGVPADRQFLIRGALDIDSIPFRPRSHRRHEPFVIGRLARLAADKWPASLWEIITRTGQDDPVCGDVMGWTPALKGTTGEPPAWIRTRPPGEIPVSEYLSGLHAILCLGEIGGYAPENWSRVVLEAMAAGVPVLAENAYGFTEQIVDSVTGMLCDTESAFVDRLVRLARDEPFRIAIAERARMAVQALADPSRTAMQWKNLFQKIRDPAIDTRLIP